MYSMLHNCNELVPGDQQPATGEGVQGVGGSGGGMVAGGGDEGVVRAGIRGAYCCCQSDYHPRQEHKGGVFPALHMLPLLRSTAWLCHVTKPITYLPPANSCLLWKTSPASCCTSRSTCSCVKPACRGSEPGACCCCSCCCCWRAALLLLLLLCSVECEPCFHGCEPLEQQCKHSRRIKR